MDLIEARNKLENAWRIETTFCPEDYLEHDLAWGQCAVTAIRLQDWLGGNLRCGWASYGNTFRTRHYWNEIYDLDIDLTWRQFPVGTQLSEITYIDYRSLIENKWMENKLELLRYLTN